MDNSTTISELKDLVEQFVKERDWEQFHSPKNLSMAIAVEAAELMDLFKWHTPEESTQRMSEGPSPAEEEIADVVIYCLAFANRNNIDLTTAIRNKIALNAQKYPADHVRGSAAKYTG